MLILTALWSVKLKKKVKLCRSKTFVVTAIVYGNGSKLGSETSRRVIVTAFKEDYV